MKTLPLTEEHKVNFQTLKLAVEYEDVALISAVRKSDGKQVALVCAINHTDGNILPVPIAEMIDGNPYEIYYDPTREKTVEDPIEEPIHNRVAGSAIGILRIISNE